MNKLAFINPELRKDRICNYELIIYLSDIFDFISTYLPIKN